MMTFCKRLWLSLVLLAAGSLALLLSDLHSRVGARNQKEVRSTRIPVALLKHASNSVLDEAEQGVVEQLASAGYVDGERLALRRFCAEGDLPTANAIARRYRAQCYGHTLRCRQQGQSPGHFEYQRTGREECSGKFGLDGFPCQAKFRHAGESGGPQAIGPVLADQEISYSESLMVEAAMRGMRYGLKEAGLVQGENVTLRTLCAQGDMAGLGRYSIQPSLPEPTCRSFTARPPSAC
jgi:hypothetical protein